MNKYVLLYYNGDEFDAVMVTAEDPQGAVRKLQKDDNDINVLAVIEVVQSSERPDNIKVTTLDEEEGIIHVIPTFGEPTPLLP